MRVLDPSLIRVAGALMAADTTLSRLIQAEADATTGRDPTIVDLLIRLDQAADNQLRASELSRQLLLSRSHVSRTLDRAEEAGLVTREPDPMDRRAALVTMTPAGRAVVVGFAPRLLSLLDRIVHGNLSGDEVDTLVELLDRIASAAVEPAEDT